MKIVVLVKEVPDTYGDRKLSLETGLADRGASESVLDEIGERALEVALSYADKNAGTEVVVLSMAPASAVTTVRKGLAMGAASAVQVVDEALLQSPPDMDSTSSAQFIDAIIPLDGRMLSRLVVASLLYFRFHGDRALAAGVEVTFESWAHGIHVWPVYVAAGLPEAALAIEHLAAFLVDRSGVS